MTLRSRERKVSSRRPSAVPARLSYSSREAAQLLDISTRTLARLTARGELKVARLGARVLYRHADLVSLIDAHLDMTGEARKPAPMALIAKNKRGRVA